MKISQLITGIVLILAVIIIVLVVKTYAFPFKKYPKTEVETPKVDISDEALKRFVGGLRIPTVSSVNYEETNFEPFNRFKDYLQSTYPLIYQTMDTVTINEHGLVFHWKGKDSSKKPIMFLSHYDVVPVTGYDVSEMKDEPAEFDSSLDHPLEMTENKTTWDYPPFSGTVKNGRIYGRGTLDMKCMLFALLEAANTLIQEGFTPDQDVYFAFGHDEEVSGRHGAVYIANYFKEKGITFDAVYDEGGIIAAPKSALPTIDRPIALVGLGEKGFLTLKITVNGIGGHSSMPPKEGSLVKAAEIIEKLNTQQLKPEIITPIAAFLTNIGDEMGTAAKVAIANQWLLKPLLIKTLSNSPASNALIRTTTAVTMAKGSDAPNVLSSTAEVVVNFRILPGSTVQEIKDHVESICKGYDVKIETISEREPSSISPEDTLGFHRIQTVMAKYYPNAIVTPYITIGGTDAYKYQIVSNNIYRFMPVELNAFEQRTIHNENESISIENYAKMIDCFKLMMEISDYSSN